MSDSRMRVRAARLRVWMTEAEMEQVRRAAAMRDQTVSDFVREYLLSAPQPPSEVQAGRKLRWVSARTASGMLYRYAEPVPQPGTEESWGAVMDTA